MRYSYSHFMDGDIEAEKLNAFFFFLKSYLKSLNMQFLNR